MSNHLTDEQLLAIRDNIQASNDPAVIAARGNGADIGRDDTTLAAIYNANSAFIVFKSSEDTTMIGKVINYVALAAITAANQTQLQIFLALNPFTFDPRRADIGSFFDNTFAGALGGQGQATRDALQALRRRPARRVEALFATGTGTTIAPGALVFEGAIDTSDLGRAFRL